MNAISIALIVALSSTIAPLMLAWLTGRQRRADKKMDWARQDEVAAKTEEVARLAKLTADHVDEVAKQAAKAAILLAHSDERANERSLVVSAQLTEQAGQMKQLHTLANSSLTAAMEATLEATKAQLILMGRIAPGDLTEKDALAIELLESKIASQEATLKERAIQTEIGQRQAAEGHHE